jgi:hypothetical protein
VVTAISDLLAHHQALCALRVRRSTGVFMIAYVQATVIRSGIDIQGMQVVII